MLSSDLGRRLERTSLEVKEKYEEFNIEEARTTS